MYILILVFGVAQVRKLLVEALEYNYQAINLLANFLGSLPGIAGKGIKKTHFWDDILGSVP